MWLPVLDSELWAGFSQTLRISGGTGGDRYYTGKHGGIELETCGNSGRLRRLFQRQAGIYCFVVGVFVVYLSAG